MVEIDNLTRLIDGAHRNISLLTNTIVVDNIKLKLGNSDSLTFSGLLTDDRTVYFPDSDVNVGHIISLTTLTGVAGGSTNLGLFTGSIIGNNRTIKVALQELEEYIENSLPTEFADASFSILDDSDATKKIKFEASNISTLQSRTIIMPDADVDLGDMQADILALQNITSIKEKHPMDALPTNSTYIDLLYQAIEPTLIVSVDRLLLHEDDDYTVSVEEILPGEFVTRLTWVGDIAVGGSQAFDPTDVVRVKYYYQA